MQHKRRTCRKKPTRKTTKARVFAFEVVDTNDEHRNAMDVVATANNSKAQHRGMNDTFVKYTKPLSTELEPYELTSEICNVRN